MAAFCAAYRCANSSVPGAVAASSSPFSRIFTSENWFTTRPLIFFGQPVGVSSNVEEVPGVDGHDAREVLRESEPDCGCKWTKC